MSLIFSASSIILLKFKPVQSCNLDPNHVTDAIYVSDASSINTDKDLKVLMAQSRIETSKLKAPTIINSRSTFLKET